MHNHQPLATCLTVWLCALFAAAATARAADWERSKAGLPRDSVPALTKDYFGAEATWLERDGDFVRRTYIRLPPR